MAVAAKPKPKAEPKPERKAKPKMPQIFFIDASLPYLLYCP
jgi:hypothetical protein